METYTDKLRDLADRLDNAFTGPAAEAVKIMLGVLQDLFGTPAGERRTPRMHNRFIKRHDGWILDRFLDVEWGPSSEKTMTFKRANTYCKKLDARLPDSHELMSLIAHSRRYPASYLDMKYDDWYWTGTTVAGCPGLAWCVCFYSGHVYNSNKGNGKYVRPVRSRR